MVKSANGRRGMLLLMPRFGPLKASRRPEWIGWWVICGDLPTDYISSADAKPPQHPRNAMRVFAENWLHMVDAWKHGRQVENSRIAGSTSLEELAPLLEARHTSHAMGQRRFALGRGIAAETPV